MGDQRMHVRPAPRREGTGRLVVGFPGRPAGQHHLADAGELVPRTAYWLRRLACGDVEHVTQTAAPKSSAPTRTRKRTAED